MIRKYHNHKPQTTPWHREEEPLNRHETPGRQIKQSNQLSLPPQDDCNTRMDISKNLERTHSYVQLVMEQTQSPIMGSTINIQQQQNLRFRTTSPFLVICMEKQFSENVSIDAFDNNQNSSTSMLNVQDNTGMSFYIVSIQV